MSKFDQYFLMKLSDVAQYAREKMILFDPDAQLDVTEIGDGNVNYIFRVWDAQSGKSVIIKQAGPTARISDAFVLSTDRARIEANMLILEHELAPGLVPLLYKYATRSMNIRPFHSLQITLLHSWSTPCY